MRFHPVVVAPIVLSALAAGAGCSGPSQMSDPQPDSSINDSGMDAPDSADDAGTDATTDTTEDVTVDATDATVDAGETVTVRVATFNTSLFRDSQGELLTELQAGSEQANDIARVVQHLAPDVLLINEFDYDLVAAELFVTDYLGADHEDLAGIDYPYWYAPTSNTGVSSGFDLDNNGATTTDPGSIPYGNDSFGFGQFEGQYGLLVVSRYPIDEAGIRTFQNFLWTDMTDALLPDDPGTDTPDDWYDADEIAVMRLSSKNHADVPITIGDQTLHFLVSHPTPPSFDGQEDRNGRRNHDEIRLWVDYVSGRGDYIVDDNGTAGTLADSSYFVVAGDLNSDPNDGGSRPQAIRNLLSMSQTSNNVPMSAGGTEAAERDGDANDSHTGDASADTADFSDGAVGNLRVDYVVPSVNFTVVDSGVFWPVADSPEASLANVSDHHAVWVDLQF